MTTRRERKWGPDGYGQPFVQGVARLTRIRADLPRLLRVLSRISIGCDTSEWRSRAKSGEDRDLAIIGGVGIAQATLWAIIPNAVGREPQWRVTERRRFAPAHEGVYIAFTGLHPADTYDLRHAGDPPLRTLLAMDAGKEFLLHGLTRLIPELDARIKAYFKEARVSDGSTYAPLAQGLLECDRVFTAMEAQVRTVTGTLCSLLPFDAVSTALQRDACGETRADGTYDGAQGRVFQYDASRTQGCTGHWEVAVRQGGNGPAFTVAYRLGDRTAYPGQEDRAMDWADIPEVQRALPVLANAFTKLVPDAVQCWDPIIGGGDFTGLQ